MGSEQSAQRRWLGEEPDDRRAARRSRLIEAGLQIMGTEGAAATTMRATCRQAKLTERYFYESFDGRDDMLVAVFDYVVFGARDTLVTALTQAPVEVEARVRYIVRAFTAYIAADRRRGRIMFFAPQEAPELTQRGEELVGEFIALMAAALQASGGSRRPGARTRQSRANDELNSTAMFGAMAYLYQRWLSGSLKTSQRHLVDHITATIVAQLQVDGSAAAATTH